MFTWFILVIALAWSTRAQYNGCDYYQKVDSGQVYYIYNQEYPDYYQSGQKCRWYAESGSNTRMELNCSNFNIPYSANCEHDQLVVSRSGSGNLADGHKYCGSGSLTEQSDGNRMNIVLNSSGRIRNGGRFLCSFRSMSNGNQPPSNNCNCGWKKTNRIVGGYPTGINEYPMMAGFVDIDLRLVVCGSTIISSRYVLTAAHCTEGKVESRIGVLVGDHDLSTTNETPYSKLYKVSKYTMHPNYISNSQDYDIAIMKTSENILFRLEVGPVCLPFKYLDKSFSGFDVDILGWGTTQFTGVPSDVLLETKLKIISNSECQNLYGKRIAGSTICTKGDRGYDACQSDSGGPVLWTEPNTGRLHLIGIIGSGISCGTGIPGLNTRVSTFLEWITTVASDAQFCIS